MKDINARRAASFSRRGYGKCVDSSSHSAHGSTMKPLTAAIVAILYPASLTFAQGTRDEPAQLEEIVVTATRRDLNLQNVGQSVSAFSTADIERMAMQGSADVIAALPSVNLVAAMPGRNAIVMRGISTGSSEYRTDSQVAVYLDDQPMTSISTQVEVRTIDLKRIEALPGPQGTLFGSSSQAGTIRYITNKPDPTQFSSQIDAEIGTTSGGEESYDVSGHVNLPVTESLAVRLTGFYAVEGGYVDNVLGLTLVGDRDNADVVEEDWNDYTTYGGRVAAKWQINPDWEGTLSLVSQWSEADGAWESDPALGDYKITRFFDEYRDDDWYQVGLNTKGDLGFAELSATAAYFDRSIKYEWDHANYSQWRSAYYGGFDPETGEGSYNVYNTGVEIGTRFNDQTQKRTAFEVRLTSQGESRLAWMAGAFYEDVEDAWDLTSPVDNLMDTVAWEYANYYSCEAQGQGYDVACPLAPTGTYYFNRYKKTIKQTAVFGELSYSLTDQWTVTGGARWFEYDREQSDIYYQPFGFPIRADFSEGGSQHSSKGTESDTVFKFATEYRIDDDRMIYALYSEGFRLGGSNSERAAEAGFLPQTYEPDKMSNYEAGIKSQWLDRTLTLNLSLFYMEWDSIQLNVSGSRAGSPFWMRGTFNGGAAEQKGAELNGAWQATDNLNFQFSLFFADPEFTEETNYPDVEDDGTAIPAGTPMPISPEEKYWVAVDYRMPNFMDLDGDLWTRFSYSYQGEVWKSIGAIEDYVDAETPEARAEARELLIPSYSTGTFQLGYTASSGWETALVVRNVFDEDGYNYISSSNYGASPEIGWDDPRWKYVRSLQRPRTVSLTFSKKW